MRQIVVATVIGESNKPIKYRILNISTGKVYEMDRQETYKAASTIGIDGISTYGKYQIIGSNGSLDNYSIIKDDVLITENKLVILNEIKYGNDICGYRVCDCFGNIVNVTDRFIRQYIKEKGIANGILIDDKLKPFTGTYSTIEVIKEDRYDIDSDIDVKVTDCGNKKIYSINNRFGTITGYKLSEKKNIFWVDYIEVYEEYRKRGIGSQLYKALEKYINSNNIAKTIMLGVSDSISTDLFIKQGFKVLEYTADCTSLPESAILSKRI